MAQLFNLLSQQVEAPLELGQALDCFDVVRAGIGG